MHRPPKWEETWACPLAPPHKWEAESKGAWLPNGVELSSPSLPTSHITDSGPKIASTPQRDMRPNEIVRIGLGPICISTTNENIHTLNITKK